MVAIEKYTAIFPVRDELESLRISIPFLVANSKYLGEIFIVIDDEKDRSREIQALEIENVSILLNQNRGVFSAIETAVEFASFPYLVVGAADDILPLLKFDDILLTLINGNEFTSATRYSKGGKRYGGNVLGRRLSILANFILRIIYRDAFSDFTTGFKGFRRSSWSSLLQEADGQGWSCALKFSLNAIKNGLNICEVPIISVDRVMGGHSTFQPWRWVKSYSRMIFK